MLYQYDPIKEFQFIFYIIPFIIGLQLAIYFIYQYYKIQNLSLALNKILLSFSTFIILLITSPLLIQISRNFAPDNFTEQILSKIGWVFGLSSPIGMEIFILNKEFAKIINLRTIKGLMILNILSIPLAIMAPSSRSPLFFIAVIMVAVNGLNLLRFEYILIKKSIGLIKTNFKLFFLGTIISIIALVSAILVGSGVLSNETTELFVYYLGTSILTIGFIILFISAYNFPPFYEFELAEHVLELYIINQTSNTCLYHYKFMDYALKENNKSPMILLDERDKGSLFSKGITGVETIISVITKTSKDKINKIEQEEKILFLEYGIRAPSLLYVLVVKRDLESYTYLLKNIRNQFEAFYNQILMKLSEIPENQEKLFSSFHILLNYIIS
ncbi:MAG: hypothetical protein GF317_12385 [Candidatus Lokiarchaeota archaeon]|nr:hypothetical protein [Candidatus Lokiarchaeota archaeon]MBD3200446.1 hypothetical protein [Candidatus Lokiarchaeota archaeon]